MQIHMHPLDRQQIERVPAQWTADSERETRRDEMKNRIAFG